MRQDDLEGVPPIVYVRGMKIEEAVNGIYDALMQILTDSLNSITITFRLIPELVEVGLQIGISHLVRELTR